MMTSMVKASLKISILLFITFMYSAITVAQPTYLYHNCSSNKTFAPDSAFQSDRSALLSSLTSANTDFYNNTFARDGDTVYGLFMCRGDVNLSICHQCVLNASQLLPFKCSVSKEAIIWYDECMLRYSYRSFFSTVDTRPRLGLLNTRNVSNQASFMRTLYDAMNKIADEAANKTAERKNKYEIGKANFSAFQTLYTLAQCTPDLSPSDCRRCLSGVIRDLDWCCDGKKGGRVLYPSCNIRYELNPFYYVDDQPETMVSPPPPEVMVSPPPPHFSPPTNASDPQGIVQPS